MLLNSLFQPRFFWEGDSGGAGGASGGQAGGDGDGQGGQQGGPAGDGGQPGPVPYERFAQVNSEFKALKAEFEKIQAAQKTAAEKEATQRGEWEKIAKQREAELTQERQARLRLEVATKKGLPVDMAARLMGATQEELEKDADAMLKFLKPADGPGVPPAGKGGGVKPLDLSKMTPAQIRDKKAELWKQEVQGQ